MELIRKNRGNGISANAMRVWGILFLVAGMVSRCVLQGKLLGLSSGNTIDMLALLNENRSNMTLATVSIILQALEACAVPVFALLLAEGFRHTSNWKQYLLRVAAIALISEVPYDLVMNSKVWDMTAQNPSMGLVFGMVLLYFYNRFSQPTASHRLLKVFILIAAILWAEMLRIEHGTPLILLTTVLWLMRERTNFRGLAAAGVALACTFVSPFYFVASMGCLPIHMYNGEEGARNRIVNYFAYPVLLIAVLFAANFLI
jgi:hypothetical protein